MSEKARLLQAHVQFELDRWAGPQLQESIASEVRALVDWLASVPLAEALPEQAAIDLVVRALSTPPTDEVVRLIDRAVDVVHQALLDTDAVLADQVPRERYELIVAAVVEAREVRPAVISQLTASKVYAELISYVLYHGIKSYLVTENVLARRIPGATSLLRLGQSAINTAAPNLERAVDRQLVAFISANVQETIRGSSTFLISAIDDEMIRTIADEVWSTNAGAPVAGTADLLDAAALERVTLAARETILHLLGTPLAREIATGVVRDYYRSHRDLPVADLLERLGVRPDGLAGDLGRALAPLVRRAHDSGYLEARIRSRLDAFYSSYFSS